MAAKGSRSCDRGMPGDGRGLSRHFRQRLLSPYFLLLPLIVFARTDVTYCRVKAAEQNKAKRYVMSAAMYQALVQAVKPP